MARKSSGVTRYAIYLRCSSDDQAQGDFTTIDTQRELNTRHILEQGGTLVKEYSDEGKTGTNLKRPGWNQLLADAQSGLFDAVCVTYMSRLARGEAYHIAEYLLKEAGVRIELVREQFTQDLAGHVNKQMTILMDGMYPKMVSQWTKAKQEQMVHHGYFTGGLIPFGYLTEFVSDPAFTARNGKEPPKRLVPDPDNAPFVRRAFEVFIETRSYNRAADYLRSVTPRKWTVNAVRHILHNEVYRGVLRHGEKVNYTAFPPVVSEALWDAARDAEQVRLPRSPKQSMKDTAAYYLRGLVYCTHCGCRMTPAGHHGMTGKQRYYECLSAMKKITTDCPTRRVNAQALHTAVLTEITRCAKHPTRIQGYINAAMKLLPENTDLKAQAKAIERRLKEIEQRIGRVQAAIEEGGSIRSLVERLNGLEQERLSVEGERARLETLNIVNSHLRPDAKRVAEAWTQFGELWEEMTNEERERVMFLLVEKVDILDKQEGTCQIRIFDKSPSRQCNLSEPIERLVSQVPLTPATLKLLLSFPRRADYSKAR